MKRFIISALVMLLALAGCAATDSASQSGQAQPESPSASTSASENPTEKLRNTDFYTFDGQSVRWSGDGKRFEYTRDGSLIELDLNNELVGETPILSPLVAPPAPNKLLSWNDSYIFAPPGDDMLTPRVMALDGKDTIVNADIFDRDGKLVHSFPRVGYDVVENSREKYESSVPLSFSTVQWLDEDVFAVDLQAKLYLYSVSRDELRLVNDASGKVAEGWTVGMSNSFGSRSVGVDGGSYYYSLCLKLDDSRQSVDELWRVSWDAEPQQLASGAEGESYSYRVGNGVMMAARTIVYSCPTDGEYATLVEQFTALTSEDGFKEQPDDLVMWRPSVVHDSNGGYLTFKLPHWEKSLWGQEITFIYNDIAGGTQVVFDPVQVETRTAKYGGFEYIPLKAVATDGGVTIWYQTTDTNAEYDYDKTECWLDVYNTATGEHKSAPGTVLITDPDNYITGISPDGLYFVEAGKDNTLRICGVAG